MKQTFHESVWRIRDYRRLALGRSIAAAGTALITVVQLLRLTDHGGGPDVIMLLLLAEALPPILLAGTIGQIADHLDSKPVLAVGIAAQSSAALLLVSSPGLLLTCCAMALLSSGASLVGPIFMVLVPMVVGEKRIGAAIGGQQALTSALGPVGAGAGGLLYGGFGAGASVLVASVLYLQLFIVSMRLGVRRSVQPVPATGGTACRFRKLLPDTTLLRRDRFVWLLTLSVVPLIVVVQGVNVLEVSLARNDLGASAAQFGFSEVAAGAGAVLGAALAAKILGTRLRGWVILGGFGACSAAIAVLGTVHTVGAYFALLPVIGLGAGMANACFGALFISRTPAPERGRVTASINGLVLTAVTSSVALGGISGGLLGVRAAFVAAGSTGLVVLATAAIALDRAPTTAPGIAVIPASAR